MQNHNLNFLLDERKRLLKELDDVNNKIRIEQSNIANCLEAHKKINHINNTLMDREYINHCRYCYKYDITLRDVPFFKRYCDQCYNKIN